MGRHKSQNEMSMVLILMLLNMASCCIYEDIKAKVNVPSLWGPELVKAVDGNTAHATSEYKFVSLCDGIEVTVENKAPLKAKTITYSNSDDNEHRVSLVYKGPDTCRPVGNATKPISVTVVVLCKLDQSSAAFALASRDDDYCNYVFTLLTSAICGPGSATPTEAHGMSGFGTFLLVVLLIIAVYLIGGALYNRFVVGKQGLEQIPNYQFWRRCGRRFQTTIDELRETNQNRPNQNSYRHYPDDLMYDQPPLTVTTTPSTEDYNPPVPHNRRDREDADERLIQP